MANDGEDPYTVQPGDRIAQLMFQPVVQVSLSVVEEFSTETERGSGGFGSTGKA
ncbi:Deoxyuridine 5'-triphosphate nucleotidohydrolase Dut [Aeromonas veronii B565]|nr:Deoxyuridine 5'-triphosphate nucleotidohydrolase Dut [Aeromonas veronii B565]